MKKSLKTKLPKNWRDRIEISFDPIKSRSKKVYPYSNVVTLKFKRGSTPKGFKNYIGDLYADKNGFIERANVVLRMRNKGLGKIMYEEMLNNVGKIETKLHDASEKAQRVWKSLAKKYPKKVFYDIWSDKMSIKK